jgi:hypothetical protein
MQHRIFYVNVGNMPKAKAAAYAKEMLNHITQTDTLNLKTIVIPIREGDGNTRVEYWKVER